MKPPVFGSLIDLNPQYTGVHRVMIIALDGPAGSGKSTVAKALSEQLKVEYIDSGAIYRSMTLFGMRRFENNCQGHEAEIADFFTQNPSYLGISYENHTQKMTLDGQDVSQEIRDPKVTKQVRYVAGDGDCRNIVNETMRRLSADYPVVIDGRDIGTTVFPGTPFKFYLDASPEIRTIRRALELNIPTRGDAFNSLLNDIVDRDRSDMEREIGPLAIAADAIVIDTSEMNIGDVVTAVASHVQLIIGRS